MSHLGLSHAKLGSFFQDSAVQFDLSLIHNSGAVLPGQQLSTAVGSLTLTSSWSVMGLLAQGIPDSFC